MAPHRSRSVLVEHLAQNIRAVRDARGLTLEELAELCDLSVGYISMLERSERTAPLNTVERIANAMGLEPHALITPPRTGR